MLDTPPVGTIVALLVVINVLFFTSLNPKWDERKSVNKSYDNLPASPFGLPKLLINIWITLK